MNTKNGIDHVKPLTWQEELDRFFAQQQQPLQFPPTVQTQVRRMPEKPTPQDCKGRHDLTRTPLCTIDDESAQDFDDAVYGEQAGEHLRVVVAIADVSYYVKPETPLDQEAQSRAFSLYYPANCIPMLPHELSAGLCSLKPHVKRLCVVMDMQIDFQGHIHTTRLYRAVMCSHARLTYKQVQHLIEEKDGSQYNKIPPAVAKSLQVLVKASRMLRRVRQDKGSLQLHMPQHTVCLDASGKPKSIDEVPRLESCQLIEDLMIAANESVARLAVRKKMPFVFRTHPAPKKEKLAQFVTMAQSLGALSSSLKFQPENVTNRSLARLHEYIIGRPLQGMLDPLLLRCMMQANYSTCNTGHFGLASGCYTHFTSPIRRYPDLMVHRFLLSHLLRTTHQSTKKTKLPTSQQLEELAQHCNQRERDVMDLERQLNSMHQAWIMQQHVGKNDSALVVGCSPIGLFLQLKSFHATGLLPISQLGKKRIAFDAIRLRLMETATGDCIQMGDELRVRIVGVHVSKGHTDLLPIRPVSCLRDLHMQSANH
ncbi:MAG: VacB/RNase II family 3'-5' exoribonuclease [Myxococcota bacterium]